MTPIVRRWLSGRTPNHGLLLKQAEPGQELASRLLGTLPWESDADAALRKARASKRLVLACVRGWHDPSAENLPELQLMAVAFADPVVAALVKHGFVPVRICVNPASFTFGHQRGGPHVRGA